MTNQLILNQLLVAIIKLSVSNEEEDHASTTEVSKPFLSRDIEPKFNLATSVSALEEIGFVYNEDENTHQGRVVGVNEKFESGWHFLTFLCSACCVLQIIYFLCLAPGP